MESHVPENGTSNTEGGKEWENMRKVVLRAREGRREGPWKEEKNTKER